MRWALKEQQNHNRIVLDPPQFHFIAMLIHFIQLWFQTFECWCAKLLQTAGLPLENKWQRDSHYCIWCLCWETEWVTEREHSSDRIWEVHVLVAIIWWVMGYGYLVSMSESPPLSQLSKISDDAVEWLLFIFLSAVPWCRFIWSITIKSTNVIIRTVLSQWKYCTYSRRSALSCISCFMVP